MYNYIQTNYILLVLAMTKTSTPVHTLFYLHSTDEPEVEAEYSDDPGD